MCVVLFFTFYLINSKQISQPMRKNNLSHFNWWNRLNTEFYDTLSYRNDKNEKKETVERIKAVVTFKNLMCKNDSKNKTTTKCILQIVMYNNNNT